MLLACAALIAVLPDDAPAIRPAKVDRHVMVYHERGRFGGLASQPRNLVVGDEILVGFSKGEYASLGPDRHNIARDKPEHHLLARSRDGGKSWSIENPSEQGALIPVGEALHGVTPPGLKEKPWLDPPGDIPFTHPDFALTARMTSANAGPARFYYSTDRGHRWEGPFRLPLFGTPGVAARTDYIVNGKDDCSLFLTAAKPDGKEGRPFMARSTDGGRAWKFVSWIADEPPGFAIMPATVRIGPAELLTAIRHRDGSKHWIATYRSLDDGVTWKPDGRPAPDTGGGNPASLTRLADGRIVLVYGYRAAPYSMRARISRDGGHSWGDILTLRDDGAGRDLGYPRTVQRADGKLVSLYYFWDQKTGPERYIAATIWDPE